MARETPSGGQGLSKLPPGAWISEGSRRDTRPCEQHPASSKTSCPHKMGKDTSVRTNMDQCVTGSP